MTRLHLIIACAAMQLVVAITRMHLVLILSS